MENEIARVILTAIGIVLAIWLLSLIFSGFMGTMTNAFPIDDYQPMTQTSLMNDNLPISTKTQIDDYHSTFPVTSTNSQQDVDQISDVNTLTGNQEVPPVQTPAIGYMTITLDRDHKTLNYEIVAKDLSTPLTGAHFHIGAIDQNGPIIKTINLRPIHVNSQLVLHENGVWKNTDPEPLTPEFVNELLNGNIYVNLHTQRYPDGEIRAQLLHIS